MEPTENKPSKISKENQQPDKQQDSQPNNQQVQETVDLMESLQIMAQQQLYSGLDLQQLDKEQVDQLLRNMAQHDQQYYDLQAKRLDITQRLELERIRSKVLHKRTLRYLFIGVSLFVLPVVTLLILFYKEVYFIPWLTFLTGILGGVGLSKLSTTTQEPSIKQLLAPTKKEER